MSHEQVTPTNGQLAVRRVGQVELDGVGDHWPSLGARDLDSEEDVEGEWRVGHNLDITVIVTQTSVVQGQ